MPFGDSEDEDSENEHQGKKIFQLLWHVRTYYGRTHYLKMLTKQANQKKGKHFKKKKRYTKHKVNVMVQKQVKKALKQKKRKRTEELRAFEK